MKSISYCITVCNEVFEVELLLDFLIKWTNPTDEIIVLFDEESGIPEVEELLTSKSMNGEFRWYRGCLNRDFASFKNNFIDLSSKDYIFQVDADEMLSEGLVKNLPSILECNEDVDIFSIPRINTVDGITDYHIQKWGWRLNDKGWINFPDYQFRLFKNNLKVKWHNKVHEVLKGDNCKVSNFPEDKMFCILHRKNIEKQESQNSFYETL